MPRFTLLSSFTLALAITCITADAAEFDVYFIGGQSNASGRGDTADIPVGSPLASAQTDVGFYWTKTLGGVINGNLTQNQWIDLQPGSGHGKNSPSGHPSEFGPELSFGRTLADAMPDRNTMIIKYSHGGSNLHTDWAAGGTRYTTFTNTVQSALTALDNQGDTYNLNGMIWLQGEADAGTAANANAYQANLVDLIGRIRNDVFAGEDAPFVLTQLSDNQYTSVNANVQTVRNAQANVVNLLPNVASINTDDDALYTTYSNGRIHFDANGQINLGNALGQGMLSLLPSEPDVFGDHDGNGFVSQSDLDLVLLNWGDNALPPQWVGTDNFDGQVSQNELDEVLLKWGDGTPPAAHAIPEPAVASLIAVGLGVCLTRRVAK